MKADPRILLVLIAFTSTSQQLVDWVKIKPLRAYVQSKGRIIGGDEVEPHSAPHQVGLKINGNQYFCGGVLISENYVLTAAHCGIVMRSVDVILGAHNISNSEEPTQVILSGESIINHENYNDSNYLNDITLIKLSEPVTFNDNIQPIKLAADPDRVYEYEIAKATGWGLLEDVPFPSLRDMSTVLMGVEVVITNMTDCRDYYNYEDEIYVTSGNICTSGYRNKGTCGGDSGGPLVLNDELIGITSFGTELCELCSPSVYTRVDQYLEWIVENSDVVIEH